MGRTTVVVGSVRSSAVGVVGAGGHRWAFLNRALDAPFDTGIARETARAAGRESEVVD